jgi:hypothetical protein
MKSIMLIRLTPKPTWASILGMSSAYLNEFTFRFNRRFYPFNAFRSLLGIGTNGEGPTYDGLYSGEWKHHTMASHHGGEAIRGC